MWEAVVAAISAVSAILCAYIASNSKKESEKQEKRRKDDLEAAELRRKEAALQLRMIHANSQLTVGVAMALKRGHCNGEVEAGLKAVNEADEAYSAFLEETALRQIRS